jgi:hypothetical protein
MAFRPRYLIFLFEMLGFRGFKATAEAVSAVLMRPRSCFSGFNKTEEAAVTAKRF